ncbi:hypothetical protein RAA17_23065 [Komagataeibacter rhaeticus]|nr:hypothetical protein [Komagataeibacter rhaeticus]
MVVPFRWLVSVLCMVLLAAPAARAAQSAAVSSERARVTLVTDDDAYMPGRALHVGLQMHLAPAGTPTGSTPAMRERPPR